MLKMFPVSKSDQSSHFPEDAKATAYNSHNSNKSSRIENGNRVSDDQSMRKPSLTNQNRLLQAQLINEEGVISWEDDKERQLTDLSVALDVLRSEIDNLPVPTNRYLVPIYRILIEKIKQAALQSAIDFARLYLTQLYLGQIDHISVEEGVTLDEYEKQLKAIRSAEIAIVSRIKSDPINYYHDCVTRLRNRGINAPFPEFKGAVDYLVLQTKHPETIEKTKEHPIIGVRVFIDHIRSRECH